MSSDLPVLPSDDTFLQASVSSAERLGNQPNAVSSPNNNPEAPIQQQEGQESDAFSTGVGRKQVKNPSLHHPAFQHSVGAAFRSRVYPSGVALMTNPLYPTTSSPESSVSPPPSTLHIDQGLRLRASAVVGGADGAEVVPEMTTTESASEFLQKRKAAAAQQRQKLPGIGTGDPDSAASQAIVKRRSQVLSTVEKARSRLSQLSNETVRRRRQFGKGWFERLQKWIFEREQKRLKGKGMGLRLWTESLKSMENSYGSSVMLVFSFIRWVFLLNAVLAILWILVMIVPFLVHPPRTFSWGIFFHNLTDKTAIKSTIQGLSLDKSFVYYGGYTYQRSEQRGWYRVDYMYPVLIGATFLISFVGALGRIAGRIISSGDIAMAARLYPFSALVFASWDFHITSLEAASKLRRGIRMQLKEMLADTKIKMPKAGIRDRLMSAKRFTALFILWPTCMVATVVIVIFLVTKADIINEKLGSKFAQAVLFSVLNNTMPVLVRVLVDMEDFRPATAESVVLTKLFCLRALNLSTLFYRLFMTLDHTLAVRTGEVKVEACEEKSSCSAGFTCCTKVNLTDWNICTEQDINFCLPACTENVIGTQLLQLISIIPLVNGAFELSFGFGYVWWTSGNKRQLHIEDIAIDIVYVQALVWVGSCFSPMAAVVGFFSNLMTWYPMRIALFRTCAPVEKAYSASRTSTLTYGLLLLTLILSTIPATISIMQKSSGFCGPIHEQISMYTVVVRYIQKAPSALWITLSWLLNPAVLMGVILFLIFVVVLVQSKLVQTRQFLALTKYEMGTQRKESYEKLKRVRQFRFPMFICPEHELRPFLTYARKSHLSGEHGLSSTQSFTASPLHEGQSLPLPSGLQGWPSYDRMRQQESNECQGDGSSSPVPSEGTSAHPSISKGRQLLHMTTNQTLDNQQQPTENHQLLRLPPLHLSQGLNEPEDSAQSSGAQNLLHSLRQGQQTPIEGQQLFSSPAQHLSLDIYVPPEDAQPSAAQDWYSLGQVLRRLSRTQEQEREHPRLENAPPPQSTAEDWHSLGQVLRRLSQTHEEAEQPRSDPHVPEALHLSNIESEYRNSSESRTPVFGTEVAGQSEPSKLADPTEPCEISVFSGPTQIPEPSVTTQIAGPSLTTEIVGSAEEQLLAQPMPSGQLVLLERGVTAASIKRRLGKQADDDQQLSQRSQSRGKPSQNNLSKARFKNKGTAPSSGMWGSIVESFWGLSTSAKARGSRSRGELASPVYASNGRDKQLSRSGDGAFWPPR